MIDQRSLGFTTTSFVVTSFSGAPEFEPQGTQ